MHIASFDTTDWKEFEVQELFNVVYGVNLELVNCIETNKNDPEAVAFVSRTESNNGVSAFVKPVPGVEPQPADTITVAGWRECSRYIFANAAVLQWSRFVFALPEGKYSSQGKAVHCDGYQG